MGVRVPAFRRSGRIYRAVNNLIAPSMLNRFNPDVVHETYYAMNRHAPRCSKVVLTVFDMIHERYPESFSKWDTTSIEKAVAVKRADHVICISENTRKDLIEMLDVSPEKTSVVHLGFSLTETAPDMSVPSGRPYLLFVGNRGGYKNFESLVHAYAAEPLLRKEFDLVAFGGGAFTAREHELMAGLALPESTVRQIGGGDGLLATLYRNAALFVFPSQYEGFGIPPLEAMSFDCPVVCGDQSSVPEVVGDAAEFFDPHSVESMGATIMKVISDPALQQSLVLRGRARLKVFSWQRCAEQTMDIYKVLLS
jgi:glycosyltransferase involved in cell wall biosynthesis